MFGKRNGARVEGEDQMSDDGNPIPSNGSNKASADISRREED
jgi:hypothetical protein